MAMVCPGTIVYMLAELIIEPIRAMVQDYLESSCAVLAELITAWSMLGTLCGSYQAKPISYQMQYAIIMCTILLQQHVLLRVPPDHLDREQSVTPLPKLVRVNINQKLEILNLRTNGEEDAVDGNAVEIAHIIRGEASPRPCFDCALNLIRLCFEFEPGFLPADAIDSFGKTLQTNHYLEKLGLTDLIFCDAYFPSIRRQNSG